jgi:flavodoxin
MLGNTMKDILVVHFSRTGYTGRVAEHLAQACHADHELIGEQAPRAGLLGYWRSAREALRGSIIDIAPSKCAPRDYRLVVIGTPVWAGNVSSPVRAYIARHRAELGNVALFCTQGGSGAAKVLRKMAGLCACQPVATAFFNDAEIDGGQFLAKADAFCDVLRRAAAHASG